MLTFISKTKDKDSNGKSFNFYQCICGTEVYLTKLPTGKDFVPSCGCYYVGKQFGRLTIAKVDGESKTSKCEAKCVCGNISITTLWNLISGHTKSCGCLQKTIDAPDIQEYNIWRSMKDRCTNPNVTGYKNYGGRGISYSPSWEHFENFFKDMGAKPKGYTLERVDNDKGYSKENCRWATYYEQAINKRIQKSNTSGVEGVCFMRRISKWKARITVNGERMYLGVFENFEDAVAVRLRAEETYRGKA